MQRILLLFTILILALGIAQPAYAYLDPGNGSVLLQGLLAGFAGVMAVLKLYWQRFKACIKNLFQRYKAPKTNSETTSQDPTNHS